MRRVEDCDLFTVTRFKQRTQAERRAAWLKQRCTGVGGSDVAAIMGLTPYKTPYDVWCEKTGKTPTQDMSGRWAVMKGTMLEQVLRRHYRHTHRELAVTDGSNMLLTSRAHPIMKATLDGIIYDPATGEFGVLEIKTTSAHRAQTDWKTHDGEWKVPDYYLTQVTHYMAVTGFKFAVVYADVGASEPVEIRVERDEDDIQAVVAACEQFWQYAQQNTPPQLVSTDVDKIQQNNYPQGVELTDSADFERWASEYETYRKQEALAKQMKEQASDQLKQLVGDKRQGLLSSQFECGYKDVKFKAQPEKIIPAKQAYVQRRFYVKQLVTQE